MHTRAIASAECQSDHHLVRCQLKLNLKPRRPSTKPTTPRKSYRVNLLQDKDTLTKFQDTLHNKLETLDPDDDTPPETLWAHLKDSLLTTSDEILGHANREHRDWFDENSATIQKSLATKRTAHLAQLDEPNLPYQERCLQTSLPHTTTEPSQLEERLVD